MQRPSSCVHLALRPYDVLVSKEPCVYDWNCCLPEQEVHAQAWCSSNVWRRTCHHSLASTGQYAHTLAPTASRHMGITSLVLKGALLLLCYPSPGCYYATLSLLLCPPLAASLLRLLWSRLRVLLLIARPAAGRACCHWCCCSTAPPAGPTCSSLGLSRSWLCSHG